MQRCKTLLHKLSYAAMNRLVFHQPYSGPGSGSTVALYRSQVLVKEEDFGIGHLRAPSTWSNAWMDSRLEPASNITSYETSDLAIVFIAIIFLLQSMFRNCLLKTTSSVMFSYRIVLTQLTKTLK